MKTRLDWYTALLGMAAPVELDETAIEFLEQRVYDYLRAGGSPPDLFGWSTLSEDVRQVWIRASDKLAQDNAATMAQAFADAMTPTEDDKADAMTAAFDAKAGE